MVYVEKISDRAAESEKQYQPVRMCRLIMFNTLRTNKYGRIRQDKVENVYLATEYYMRISKAEEKQEAFNEIIPAFEDSGS